jgi:hypothetical protein
MLGDTIPIIVVIMLRVMLPWRYNSQGTQRVYDSIRKLSGKIDWDMKGKKDDNICERVNHAKYDVTKHIQHLLVMMKTMSVTIDRQVLISLVSVSL